MYNPDQEKALFTLTQDFLKKEIVQVSDISDLCEVLKYHEWKYYVQNNPVIADYEYDQLFKKLENLELANPRLVTPDSPTQRVASDLNHDFENVPHLVPMLSLGNSYNAEDLADFDASLKRLLLIDEAADLSYTVEPKYDGGSIALVYEDDLLVRGATRGNGTKGDDITNNAKAIPAIPLKAAFSKLGIYRVELRGEAIIRKDVFDKANAFREKEGLTLFANPRNAATGGLRMKDPNQTRKRGLEAFIFQIGYAVDKDGNDKMDVFSSHFESIEALGKLGFKIPTVEKKQCKNIAEAAAFCKSWEEKREAYPYEIDGMVVKVDSRKLQEKSGSTAHHPRWAIAYKFKAKQATTQLEDIEYQIGKIGSITPVAKLKPVQLAGVTVSSVSLHNEEFIVNKDLRLGDQVLVERAGDVIPYIVKSFPELRDGSEKKVIFPQSCPSCETLLVKPENEAAWRCPNYHCKEQVLQRIIFHVSKPAMNIDGFGKSYVERFNEEGWVHDIADIYNLDYEKIAGLDGFGEKSAAKLALAINKAKGNPIHRLLHSLSIHHLGKKASKLIAENIDHVFDLKEWTEETFTEIKDIGPVVAENVIAFFNKEENIVLLEKLEGFGVNMLQTDDDKPLQVAVDAPLSGKTILFTGKLLQLSRKGAQELAAKHGAKNISAVSGNLNILVVGEKAGSKLKKAQALGTVEILTEQAFISLVSE